MRQTDAFRHTTGVLRALSCDNPEGIFRLPEDERMPPSRSLLLRFRVGDVTALFFLEVLEDDALEFFLLSLCFRK